jgi:uncharacterized protein YbjT (DUF2867 family)
MKILLTGATGYIGKRLLPELIKKGHKVVCAVRDHNRFNPDPTLKDRIEVIECNFLEPYSLLQIPNDIDAAYYLIHSMSASIDNFESLEKKSAENFRNRMNQTAAKQVIYLSGIVNDQELSRHLSSRKNVEEILSEGSYQLTTLRAGIIVGSGSASFEIIRDLVEKLPVMITPRWLNTQSQPIAIRNVIQFLEGVLQNEKTYGQSFDIGGPEILTYKEMLLRFAKIRGLRRLILVVPVMTPKLSSYWLYFITSTSYKLAVNLVASMKIPIIGKKNQLHEWLKIELLNYETAVRNAFETIQLNDIPSSWTDALSSQTLESGVRDVIKVPEFGCFRDIRQRSIKDEGKVLQKIWEIGGENGWYYGNWLWAIRGVADKLFGGVGLRRGRRNPTELKTGDSLDFWRVLLADEDQKRLLLYAEMKLPGEAWLEFKIIDNILYQTATFRPLGLFGRLYWYSVMPFHSFIFKGMIDKIAE